MSDFVARGQGLTLRRVEITSRGDGKFFARLLFLSTMKSDERAVGPFDKLEDVFEFVQRVKFAVEVLGKKAVTEQSGRRKNSGDHD